MNILQKFILLIFTSLFMVVVSCNALANDTVVVTFTGQLLAKTCDITTGSKDQPVNMGTYDANDFLNVGDVSGSHTFTINLEGCPTATSTIYSSGVSANVRFSGDTDTINTTLLRLTSSADSATGVGVEILDNDDKVIAINDESGFKELVLDNNGDASLDFKLRYKSTQQNVHAGQANALLYFDIDYQ
ncbi:type 1 fimbrial protein [Escherichia marmotae]|uniref:fimbrial protein n=2 Tax=Enterobacteriaceae TaxID=543 RepID=UPI000F0B39DF|nr:MULTISPECIES: fimbrial protein [Escherichia]EFG1981777.1 type 1 fimbrial protein [Escherichia coli]EFG2026808.1 type 1 fimbrial protein [Escherichia coli]MDQ9304965.1 type 1 fimbrial protein [Escherichia marmotae]MEC9620156.1 fimbrial protein [Escherichia marmotae]MEC9791323.1 fimbrial protein [Escherichia marmotae]